MSLDNLLLESAPTVPLVGLLSAGADPSSDIESLSKKLKIEMKAISMGQGQEVHARRILSTMLQSGGWVLLQNCHLGLPFMNEINQILGSVAQIHESFRLWITTEATSSFPTELLHVSLKFTCEAPQGLRAGLQRTFQIITQDTLEVSPRPQYKPSLCSLAFLHSIIQERRKFGPLGWAIPVGYLRITIMLDRQLTTEIEHHSSTSLIRPTSPQVFNSSRTISMSCLKRAPLIGW